jgi:hypothetical protein
MPNRYVECDRHVMENVDDLFAYVGEPFKTTGRMDPPAHSAESRPLSHG